MGRWSPETQALAKRLFIAAIAIAALVIGSFALVRAGIWMPWWVPVLAFALIIVAAIARASEPDITDDASPEDPVAGRIGRGK